MKKNLKLISAIAVLAILFIALNSWRLLGNKQTSENKTLSTNAITPTLTMPDKFEYDGKDGLDALTLLKNKTSVQVDKSGLVTSINGRIADNNKHEYWAFYVNGEMASVGPASYLSKSTDKIEWKIETY